MARYSKRYPTLMRRERMLATEPDTSGVPVVATTFALYHRAEEHRCEDHPAADHRAADDWFRLALEDVGRLRWDAGSGVLDLTALTEGPASRLTLHLRRGTRIAPVVRERIAANQITGTRVPLHNGSTALVTARHRPSTAEVMWIVQVSADADPADPATEALIDAAIRKLRADTGL
jgi:hypothetical protein